MATDTKTSARKAPTKKTVAKKTVTARESTEGVKKMATTMDLLELFVRTYARF
jgi:hypothetical protein